MKATAMAHPNSAIVKYWGKSDEELGLPLNSSASVTIAPYCTRTTVEFSKAYAKDEAFVDNEKASGETEVRIVKHLDRIRKLAGVSLRARVVSLNDFPLGCGFGSSASGFAALTLAASRASELDLRERELSILARQGSGSACRSIPGGFVIWRKGERSEDSYAQSIAEPGDIDMRILMVSVGKRKEISSARGMTLAKTSPLMEAWLAQKDERISSLTKAVRQKSIGEIGSISEAESLCLHAICMTSNPPIIYWAPTTLRIMREVLIMREEGIEAYFSVDAGASVYVYTHPEHEIGVSTRLREIEGVERVLRCKVGSGARIVGKHLF